MDYTLQHGHWLSGLRISFAASQFRCEQHVCLWWVETNMNHKPIVRCWTGPWILLFVLPLKVSELSIGSYCNWGSKLCASTVEKKQINRTCGAYGTEMYLATYLLYDTSSLHIWPWDYSFHAAGKSINWKVPQISVALWNATHGRRGQKGPTPSAGVGPSGGNFHGLPMAPLPYFRNPSWLTGAQCRVAGGCWSILTQHWSSQQAPASPSNPTPGRSPKGWYVLRESSNVFPMMSINLGMVTMDNLSSMVNIPWDPSFRWSLVISLSYVKYMVDSSHLSHHIKMCRFWYQYTRAVSHQINYPTNLQNLGS